jgi:glycine betaine/choline ABC-type transport system substrate-binding protein
MTMAIDNNTPLGILVIYDPSTNQTHITWSYAEDSDIQYFILQYLDDDLGKFVPYDGQYGIIERQP